MYSAGAAAAEFPSLAAFRFRGARYLFAAIGLIGLAVPYLSGFAAFSRPAYSPPAASLPTLGIPVVRFPGLAVPKLHPAVAVPAAAGTKTQSKKQHAAQSGSRRVPVVTDTYSLSPAGASGIAKTNTPVDLFAGAPVVQDTVGTPPTFGKTPAAPVAPASTPATPAAGTDSSPAGADSAAPASTPARVAGRSLQSVADDPPAGSSSDATISSSEPPQVEAPPVQPISSGTDNTVVAGAGISAPPSIAAPVSPAGDGSVVPVTGVDGTTSSPAVDPPKLTTPTQPSVVTPDSPPSTPVAVDSQSASVAPGGSGGAGGAPTTTGSAGANGGSGTTAGGSVATTQQGTTPPPPDPAATPGSGPSPPGVVTPAGGGSAVAGDGSATVAFAPGLVSGSTVVSVVSTDVAVPGIDVSSAVYDLTATDSASGATISHFTGSPVLTISYDPSARTPTAIYYLDPVNGPVAIPSTVDTVHHTISAALPHFSAYVAGAPAVVSLTLTPAIIQAASGSATVTATVTQLGVGAQNATVQFALTGSAAFGGGTSTCVTNASGICTVTVSDATSEVVTINAVVNGSVPPASATTTLPFVDWLRTLTAGTAHTVAVSVDGSNLVHVNVDGTDSQQPSAGLLTSVGIIGGNSGDTYTLDGSLVSAGVAVYIAGGAGAESIIGPNVADMEWTISGAGVGSATSTGTKVVAFTGINAVTGGNLADTFTFLPAGALVNVDGGGGGDTLVAPDRTAANTWVVSADDQGTLNGMPFTRFGSLDGGSGPDNFSIASGVALSSGVGGGGGDAIDTLDFPAGVPTEVDTSFLGPGTGSVSRDGKTVDYSGIELITDELQPANRVLTFSSGNDAVRLDQSGVAGSFWVQPMTTAGAFATARLSDPSTGLSIQTLDGADTIMLDSFSPSFLATVSIDAGAGNDAILVALPSTLGGNVTVNGGDGIDSLDDTTLIPAANVSNVEILPYGIPQWTEEGPAPITATSVYAPYSGAVQSIAIDPFNDNIMYAGSVNGGIWLSTDGGATWTPKTDRLPTLSIGSVTIAPRDADGKVVDASTPRNKLVVYAGTGSFSSFGGAGGLSLGVLRSMDGGDSWTLLSSTTLAGIKLGAIVALDNGSGNATEDPNAQIVVVAGMTDARPGGIFRSTDSGKTFTAVALDAGAGKNATDLIADPGAPGRLYAAVVGVPDAHNLQTGGGVYRSDNRGATWAKFNAGLDLSADAVDNNANGALGDNGEKVDGAGRIVLAVSQTTGSLVNSVYAALLSAPGGGGLMGVFVSTPAAGGGANGTWTLLGGAAAAPPASATYAKATNGETVDFGATGVITRSGGDFRTDGFAVGQIITVAGAADAANNGPWELSAVDATHLTIVGTFVARLGTTAKITAAAAPASTTGFFNAAAAKTLDFSALGAITRSTGSWITDGFSVGESLAITGAADAANNGTFTISAVGTLILTITGTFAARTGDTTASLRGTPGAFTTTYQPQVNKGGQGDNHFSMAADGAGNVFISGDTLGVGGNVYVFTSKTSAGAASNAWTQINGLPLASRAYPDSRDLEFNIAARPGSNGATTGALFDTTDGGVYKLDLSTRRWSAVNGGANGLGGLGTVEIVSAAYDPLNDLVFMGAQDAGLATQNVGASDGLDNNSDGLIDNAAEQLPWTFSPSGDGNTVAAVPVFDQNGKISGYVHYVMGNNLTSLTAVTYDQSGAVTSTRLVALAAATVNLIVTLGGDLKTFTAAANGLIPEQGPFVLVSSNGNLPGGATATSQYFVKVIDANTFQLKDSGNVVTFTSAAAGNPTLRLVQLGGLQVTLGGDGKTFTLTSGADLGLQAGAGPFVMRATGGTLPGNADLATEYFIQPVTKTTFTLAKSSSSTAAAVTFTAGTGSINLLKRFSGLLGWDSRNFLSGYVSQIQYVVNAVAPGSMALGLFDLYTSADGLDTLNAVSLPAAITGRVSALAAGGTIATVAQPSVIYAAAGGNVYVSLPGGPARVEAVGTAKTIYGIALDSTNAAVAYAATDAGVFKRTGANTWVNITGNLPNAGLRQVVFVPKTAIAWGTGATQQDVVLVGGNLGVFRAFAPAAGSAVWTQVGQGLPDALVTSLSFTAINPADYAARRAISSDDILLAGTLGRGAFTLGNADVALGQSPVLTINGTSGADTITLARDSLNPGVLNVTVDGRVWSTSLLSIQKIVISGLAGADTLTVDSTNGSINVPGGIFFTGGADADSFVLRGAKVQKIDTTGSTATTKVFKVIEIGSGSSETVTFTDFVSGTDPTPDTSGLATPTTAQEIADAIARWAGLTQPPAPQLAVLGVSLPRVLRPQAPPVQAPLPAQGDGKDAGENDVSLDAPADPADPSSGISRLFTFADGSTLLDKIDDGTITDTASLLTQLALLAGGSGSVTNTGTDALPRIVINFTKTYSGEVPFDFSFDQSGGHVQLAGSLDASVDFSVNLVVGVDVDGFYIETGGGPQLSLSNIQVNGNLDGSGQFGFLGVELKNATLTVSGVGVSLTLTAASGNKIRVDDLLSADSLGPLASINVTSGSGHDVVLNADVSASAVLPGGDQPFDIGTASFSATWADITQPTNVSVSVSGAIGDFLKAKADQIVSVLVEIRDVAQANQLPLPGGFDKVLSLLQTIDNNLVHASGSTSSPSFSTVQEFAGQLALGLQTDLAGLGITFSGSKLMWDFDLGQDVLSNASFGGSGLGATLNSLHLQFALDLSKITGSGSSFSLLNAFSFTVTGDVSNLNVFDVLQGGAKFQVSTKSVDVNVDGGAFSPSPGGDLHNASLTTVGIDLNEDNPGDPQTRFLTIGTSDASLTLQDGTLAVALLSSGASGDDRSWTAVKAVGLVGPPQPRRCGDRVRHRQHLDQLGVRRREPARLGARRRPRRHGDDVRRRSGDGPRDDDRPLARAGRASAAR